MKGNIKKLKSLDWSLMPREILELFWKRLTIPDQVRVGSVCKAWLASTSDKAFIWTPHTPWLISTEYESPEYKIFSLTLQKKYTVERPLQILDYSLIVGSCKGWLLVRSYAEIFIWNILSRARIDLPSPNTMPDAIVSLPHVITMSTCAHLNPKTIAGIDFYGDMVWCNAKDKEWRWGKSDKAYGNLAFHHEKLYAITEDGSMIDIFQMVNDELIMVNTIHVTIQTVSQSNHFDVYLVDSEGGILVLKRYYERTSLLSQTIGFDIFKVQESSEDSSLELVNLESLEGEALFLSNLYCESVPTKHCVELQQGCIYFIDHSAGINESELGVFSVDYGYQSRVPLAHTTLSSPIWVLARYAIECDCYTFD